MTGMNWRGKLRSVRFSFIVLGSVIKYVILQRIKSVPKVEEKTVQAQKTIAPRKRNQLPTGRIRAVGENHYLSLISIP